MQSENACALRRSHAQCAQHINILYRHTCICNYIQNIAKEWALTCMCVTERDGRRKVYGFVMRHNRQALLLGLARVELRRGKCHHRRRRLTSRRARRDDDRAQTGIVTPLLAQHCSRGRGDDWLEAEPPLGFKYVHMIVPEAMG